MPPHLSSHHSDPDNSELHIPVVHSLEELSYWSQKSLYLHKSTFEIFLEDKKVTECPTLPVVTPRPKQPKREEQHYIFLGPLPQNEHEVPFLQLLQTIRLSPNPKVRFSNLWPIFGRRSINLAQCATALQPVGRPDLKALAEHIVRMESDAVSQSKVEIDEYRKKYPLASFMLPLEENIRRVLFLHVVCRVLLKHHSEDSQVAQEHPGDTTPFEAKAFSEAFESWTGLSELGQRHLGSIERLDEAVLPEVRNRLRILCGGCPSSDLRHQTHQALGDDLRELFKLHEEPGTQDKDKDTFQYNWRVKAEEFLKLEDTFATAPTGTLELLASQLLMCLFLLPHHLSQKYGPTLFKDYDWKFRVMKLLHRQRILLGLTAIGLLTSLRPEQKNVNRNPAKEWKDEYSLQLKCKEEELAFVHQQYENLLESLRREQDAWTEKAKEAKGSLGRNLRTPYKELMQPFPSLPPLREEGDVPKMELLNTQIAQIENASGHCTLYVRRMRAEILDLDKQIKDYDENSIVLRVKNAAYGLFFPKSRRQATQSPAAPSRSSTHTSPVITQPEMAYYPNPRR